MSRKTTNSFESTQEDSSSQIHSVQTKLDNSQKQIFSKLSDLDNTTHMKFRALKQSLNAKIDKTELKYLERHAFLIDSIDKLNKVTYQIGVENANSFKTMSKLYVETTDEMNRDVQARFQTITTRIENIENSYNKLMEKEALIHAFFDNIKTSLNALNTNEEVIISEIKRNASANLEMVLKLTLADLMAKKIENEKLNAQKEENLLVSSGVATARAVVADEETQEFEFGEVIERSMYAQEPTPIEYGRTDSHRSQEADEDLSGAKDEADLAEIPLDDSPFEDERESTHLENIPEESEDGKAAVNPTEVEKKDETDEKEKEDSEKEDY